MAALNNMYSTEFENAYYELKEFIRGYSNLSALEDELQSALTMLPFLASAIE
jgi:hypothetical protein